MRLTRRCAAVSPGGAYEPPVKGLEEQRVKAFPNDFLWGTSQSGHQIEGENFNSDWWPWEQRPGRIADGSISKEAAGHWDRFEQDLDLARDLGHSSFLFSLEWARLQPSPGEFDAESIVHYRRVFEAVRTRGLEAICVMQHVTVPRWFADNRGWHHPSAPEVFEVYAARVAEEFASLCRWWIPIREPIHWCTMAYIERRWPPASRNLLEARRCIHNMARAHARAYRALHEQRSDVLVGTGIHARSFEPLDPDSAWDIRTARRERRRCNRLWLDALTTGRWPLQRNREQAVENVLDFIGVAYYGSETIRFSVSKPLRLFGERIGPENGARGPMRYVSDPAGLRSVLGDLARYDRPLLITANGIGTDDDTVRCAYLLDNVRAVRDAIGDGVDIRGYQFRSFLDGFEWDVGYAERYGLVHVDRKTLTRTPNASALLFKELCRRGTISAGTIARFLA